MKYVTLTFMFIYFMFAAAHLQAVEPEKEPAPQHKEDDILLTFHDDKGEIIKINWNGTVEYHGDLAYVSKKFWELMIKAVPQLCQRDMIVVSPKPFERITMKTMKGDIVLNMDHIKNKMSVIYLSTLGDPAIKFWKSVEKTFSESCK